MTDNEDRCPKSAFPTTRISGSGNAVLRRVRWCGGREILKLADAIPHLPLQRPHSLSLKSLPLDGFLCALIAAVVLAVIWPTPGVSGGFLHADWVSSYGIAVVFLLYGLTLSPEKMWAGMVHWRLHLAAQSGTFILFPAVILALTPLFGPHVPASTWTGFFYLAALPSTVSSSVAMTSLARGNVPAAIFNASLSSIIGVFVTPLLMAWYIHAGGGSMPLGHVLQKIMLLVLLPIVIGQLLHRPLLGWTARHGKRIKLADRAVIIAIVYNSFCDSIAGGVWSARDIPLLVGIAVGVIALFFLIYLLMQIPCAMLGFDREDRIACLFCASKKSLATGVPLARIIFGASPALGQIIVPLILYHFFQLVIVSVIAARFARDPVEAREKQPA
jgi:sodium/bile acid cotransporter 7